MTEQLSIELIPTGLRSRSLWAAYSYFLPPGGGVRLFFSCLDYVWLFETPWTAPSQASLSFTITRSGFQYLQNSSKILLCISLNGEPGLCPKATLLFLFTGSPPSLQLFKSIMEWKNKNLVIYLSVSKYQHKETLLEFPPCVLVIFHCVYATGI